MRDALDALSGGVPDDLLGAVVLFEPLPNISLNAGRQAPWLGLGLMTGVSLSLGQVGPVSPLALVAIALQLGAERGFATAGLMGDLALGVVRLRQGRNVVALLLRQVLYVLLEFGNPKV